MSYEKHMQLFRQMTLEWHKENDRPPSIKKSMKYINGQKKKRGII